MPEKKPQDRQLTPNKPKRQPRQKRTIEIAIRVNEDELALLKQRQQGATMAGWLRGLALGVQPVKPADAELVRALGRIGSNLNQVARHVNTERTIDRQVLVEIERIRAVMHQLLADNMTAGDKAIAGEGDDTSTHDFALDGGQGSKSGASPYVG